MTENFPVGIHQFCKNKISNFELNRQHAFGFARLEDLVETANLMHGFYKHQS